MCEPLITMSFLRRRGGDDGAEYVRVCGYGDIAPGEIMRAEGLPVVLCRVGDRLYAMSWICTHAAARLAKGRLVGDCLECPLHGARFALADGAVRRGPARRRLPTYRVLIKDGDVYVSRRPRRARGMAALLQDLRHDPRRGGRC
jgi:nitrite reductase/ring-hydroxylating ferredoxin subunit